MGADGGVTLFDYEKLQKYMQKDKRRLKLAESIKPEKYGPGEAIINALLDNDLTQLKGWSPFIGFSSLTVGDTTVKVFSVSFGTNVYDSINDLENILCHNCHDAVIWTAETWT
jgi:hypothetical protein